MDSTIDGIAMPVRKRRVIKCHLCGGEMTRVSSTTMVRYQSFEPYHMDNVVYKCHNCSSLATAREYVTDKWGNWIANENYERSQYDY